MNYNNFHESLKKEQDLQARENLDQFYKIHFPDFKIDIIDYNSNENGKYLQTMGVDVVATKYNYYDSISKMYLIQEKITFKEYNSLMFEFKKKSGADGWAVSNFEKSDIIVYYQDTNIYSFNFNSLRTYLRENLNELIEKGYYKTDNHNIIVPISTLEENVIMHKYKRSDYIE